MNNFQIPENFDLETGWFVLKGMYSKEDVEKAKAIVYKHNNANNVTKESDHVTRDERHNKYNGLV